MIRLIVIITAAGILLSLLSASATLLETDGGIVDEQEVEGILPTPSPTPGLRQLEGHDSIAHSATMLADPPEYSWASEHQIPPDSRQLDTWGLAGKAVAAHRATNSSAADA